MTKDYTSRVPGILRDLRERSGLSMATLAHGLGYKTPSGYQHYETERYKSDFLKPEVAERLADILEGLGMPPIRREEVIILTGRDPATFAAGLVSVPRPVMPRITSAGGRKFTGPLAPARDLPVLGAARGGSAKMVFTLETPIDWVLRPPPLANVPDAFAVFMVGDSMSPAYEAGDILYIHPAMAIKPGRTILLEHHDGGALVTTLVKQTADCVRVAECNPEPRQFEIDRREIRAMYRVTGKWDGA